MTMAPPPLNEDERADLVAYLDGELESTTALALEAKLSRDPKARAEADQLRRAWDMLDYLPRPAPSPDFTQRTLERLSAQALAVRPARRAVAWRPFAVVTGWAAAVVVAGAIGFMGGRGLPRRAEPPPDPAASVDREQLARDLRVIENRRLYERAESVDFVRELAGDPDLFGDDG
jgi:anti-sigma factor RsiW